MAVMEAGNAAPAYTRPIAALASAVAGVAGLGAGARCLEFYQRNVEVDLSRVIDALDPAQARRGLAVPRARPAQRMHDRVRRRVSTDDPAS